MTAKLQPTSAKIWQKYNTDKKSHTATIWQNFSTPLPKNEACMKKIIDLDFSDTLETCLRFSRLQVRTLSEIIENGVDKKYESIINIIKKADSLDIAEQQLMEEFAITKATVRTIMNSPLICNIVCNAQKYLEYYREAAEKITVIIRKNPGK